MNLLDGNTNQLSKFWAKTWTGMHDNAHGTYSTETQIKLKTNDLYILVKGTITVTGVEQYK